MSTAINECETLTRAEFLDGVTSIWAKAFSECTSLVSVDIPDSVTSINSSAFYGCKSLEKVTYKGTLEQWCGISRIDGSANPLNNGKAELYIDGEKLMVVDIPDSVTEVKNYAFYGYSSLESVTIPNNVTSIGNGAFGSCASLTSVTIPASVKNIGSAFSWCKNLKTVTIDNGMTSIGIETFRNCASLTSVTIPSSIKSIGAYAFYECYSLKTVKYGGTKEDWGDIERGSSVFSKVVTEITDKDSVTFTVDKGGNITAE